MEIQKSKIGFIGQGWIGKNYADDFEARGYEIVRYALEEPYLGNKKEIKNCEITLIAVPTPTTPTGFDGSYLKNALCNIGVGKIAVIKSTTPGLVAELQKEFTKIIILHSPEFLVEKTAAYDAAHPARNIIGLPQDTPAHQAAAQAVLEVLPPAPYQAVMTSDESELVKYAGNCFLYSKVIFMNILYDLVIKSGGDFDVVRDAFVEDARIGKSHTAPVFDGGRGAGGHCFIKDFEVFKEYYGEQVKKNDAYELLSLMTKYNNRLLTDSKKDIDLLRGVFE